MIVLGDILDEGLLNVAVTEGLVRVQHHPTEPLAIFNYTARAVYAQAWTNETRQCRGLIVDTRTGEIVARPWPKFFNHGEPAAGELDLSAPVETTTKEDGSLGILYRTETGFSIATRGSFTSEQAAHATEWLTRSCRRLGWYTSRPADGWTFLFEIIYPQNRIVLDYRGADELILLGAVNIPTGHFAGPHDMVCDWWPHNCTEVHEYVSLSEALAAPPRENAEGLVVRYLNTNKVVKIKQADYVALHRVLFGLTTRTIWERLTVWAAVKDGLDAKWIEVRAHIYIEDAKRIIAAGPNWVEQIKEVLPEEFWPWIDDTILELNAAQAQVVCDVLDMEESVKDEPDRKAKALRVKEHKYAGMMFSALDDRPFAAQAWAAVYPAAEKALMTRSEDVA